MAQSSTHQAIKNYFNISEDYTTIDDDLEKYYFTSQFSDKLSDMADILSILCSNPEISNRGDLCALTGSVPELKELSKDLNDIGAVITFPNPKSTACNTDEVLDKLRFAEEYGYPFVDKNNVILKEVFDFNNNSSNYLQGYYLKQTLYTPDEKKEDKIFRGLSDPEMYYTYCGTLQGRSYMCFNKLLKPNDEFNTFVVENMANGNYENNYEQFVEQSLKYLQNDENPFLDIDQMNIYTFNEPLNEDDRGVRR